MRLALARRGVLALVSLLPMTGCEPQEQSLERSVSAVTVCPGNETTAGVDVSHWQGIVDWAAVKAAGIEFAFVHLSDGTVLDSQFSANWTGSKTAGLLRGAYVFFQPSQDSIAQADFVVQNVGTLGPGDLPVCLNVEVSGGQSAAALVAALRTTVDRIAIGTGKQPVIYTGPGFWGTSTANSTSFAGQPLFVANWGVACPSVPSGWSTWVFWQTTDHATVAGVTGAVDRDVFNGSLAELQAFAGIIAGGLDAGGADGAGPEGGAADAAVPVDATPVDVPSVDSSSTDLATQDSAAQDTAAQDTAAQDSAAQDTAAPDTAAPDTAAPDTAAPDTAAGGKTGSESGGCSCVVTGTDSSGALAVAAALALLVARRRRS